MSSPVVRDWFVQKTKSVIAEAPFMETIGTLWTKKNLPDLWSTIEFSVPGSQRLSVGGPTAIFREFGTANIVILAKSGRGDLELSNYLQKVFNLMLDQREILTESETLIQGRLSVDNVTPPNIEPYEDGNWLMGAIACVYTYDSVRGAAVV